MLHPRSLLLASATLVATLTALALPTEVQAASVTATAPARTPSATYTVKSGDTLYGIAATLKVNINDILSLNQMTLSSVIWPGMQLKVPAPAPTASDLRYTVVAGDYLGGIAAKLKVSLTALLQVNGLTTGSLIHPGMTLKVPAGGTLPSTGGSVAQPPASAATYTVVSGDYLGGIASKLKVSLDSLLAANGLKSTSVIFPGQTLRVPAGGTTSPPPAANPPASAVTYTVQPGDSLLGIASRLGVSVNDVLSLNRLQMNSLIWPGLKLTVPANAKLPASTPQATNSRVQTVLDFALAQVGKPYKFFTAGPDTFDCSGLTKRAFAQVGIALPHYSVAQATYGTAVDWTTQAIKPGDLVFLSRTGEPGTIIDHVGIATSGTSWVHAPRPGAFVTTGQIPMWRIVAVRRLIG